MLSQRQIGFPGPGSWMACRKSLPYSASSATRDLSTQHRTHACHARGLGARAGAREVPAGISHPYSSPFFNMMSNSTLPHSTSCQQRASHSKRAERCPTVASTTPRTERKPESTRCQCPASLITRG
eukprot:3941930-Rhodomonas_salina.14